MLSGLGLTSQHIPSDKTGVPPSLVISPPEEADVTEISVTFLVVMVGAERVAEEFSLLQDWNRIITELNRKIEISGFTGDLIMIY